MEAVKKYLPWVLIAWIAFVFLSSDIFKFLSLPESVALFTYIASETGVSLFEPYGRFLIGIAEVTAVVLLVLPGRRLLGALLSAVLMTGAILTHLLFIGVVVVNDAGQTIDDGTLFVMAVGVLVASLILIWLERQKDDGGGEAAPVGD